MENSAHRQQETNAAQRRGGTVTPRRPYRRFRRLVIISTLVVSVVPLFLMTAVNFYQYDRAAQTEVEQAIRRITSNNKRSLEYFLDERLAELTYIIHDKPFDTLHHDDELERILGNMKKSLPLRTLVDLGLIDSQGNQLSYVGPYELQGKNYMDQEWFHEVQKAGVDVSEVFLGYRKSPHCGLAVWHEDAEKNAYALRATIDGQMLNKQILTVGVPPGSDCFLLNREGILQTPSQHYGDVLELCPLALPPRAHETEVIDWQDENGKPIILGYADIKRSPFVLLMLSRRGDVMRKWLHERIELLLFLAASVVLILIVVVWTSNKFMNQIRDADKERATVLHKVEYTNKLASLGRLAAGTAHEINNPLAIINEKAGLLKDLYTLGAERIPPLEKVLGLTDSILKAVDRCSTITHRLLGFAKHMDVQNETLDLPSLVQEVLGFVGKESLHRNVRIEVNVAEDMPTVESDRGQLQQVFLNLINNAIEAVDDGGKIEICLQQLDAENVSIIVADDGVGMSQENLGKLFEPFFTTKGYGTGLGLSVTYGIIQKLGGHISVESEVGKWTRFTVTLPINKQG